MQSYNAQDRDVYNIYQTEAAQILPSMTRPPIWLILLKATGIFLIITIIVFFVTNYQFIKSQITDSQTNSNHEVYVSDKDKDGIPDWWEEQNGLNASITLDAFSDFDNDEASNILEYQFGTDPNRPDSDGDGYFDGEEIRKGYNPNGIGRVDTDGDGLYDWWEEVNGLDKENESDAGEDIDDDNLTNKQEFTFNTDPNNPDSDGDGKSDGQEIEEGLDPIGEGKLDIIQNQFDPNDEDGDGLNFKMENFFGTDPNKIDTDGDGYDDFKELSRGFDPLGDGTIKAELEIPAIGIKSPVIWSQEITEEVIQKDLEKGVIHYPDSAFPGFRGNSYITGHSSYYSWSSSSYKEVFKKLNELKKGDEVIFHLTFVDGRTVDVVYEIAVVGEVVLPSDQRIFRDYEGHEITLVTCWPLGTNWKRMMVKGDLVKPEFE